MRRMIKIPKCNEEKGKITFVCHFNDTPAGKVAWAVWKKMTKEQKEATGLLNIKLGDIVFVMPGVGLSAIFENGGTYCLMSQPLTISLWHRFRLWVEGFFKRSVINVTNVS